MRVLSKSLEETENIAKNFIGKLSLGVHDTALVVGLYGDLGSGKTTFTQAIGKLFGIQEDITSPTYVIEKIYPIRTNAVNATSNGTSDINHDKFEKFVHIDAYRLDSAKELLSLDWKRTFADSKNIIFIEWPERVSEILPENHAKIFFKFISEDEREIEI
jgi:tRNA threonylcarbamoyladenosine biosynthesis protein TsaE